MTNTKHEFQQKFNSIAKEYGIGEYFEFNGYSCSPNYVNLDQDKNPCFKLRTIFVQEMMKENVIFSWIALSLAHQDVELAHTERGLRRALKTYANALEDGPEKYLESAVLKPVFRKFN